MRNYITSIPYSAAICNRFQFNVSDAEYEIFADFVGNVLIHSEQHLTELAARRSQWFAKLRELVSRILTKLGVSRAERWQIESIFARAHQAALASETQKNPATESGRWYSMSSKTQPGKLDPRTVTREDVRELLERAEDGNLYGNNYFPVRICTPPILIHCARVVRNDIIDDNPIMMSAEKAYNAMNREGDTGTGRENRLSPDEIVTMIEKMNDPQYIVYQSANERYVEVVQFDTRRGDKAFAIIELGNHKDAVYMSGYESGLYNLLVTTYPPKAGKLKQLLNNKANQIVYDKKKGVPQRTSSSTVPSVLNDTPFFGISIPDSSEKSNPQYSISDEDVPSAPVGQNGAGNAASAWDDDTTTVPQDIISEPMSEQEYEKERERASMMGVDLESMPPKPPKMSPSLYIQKTLDDPTVPEVTKAYIRDQKNLWPVLSNAVMNERATTLLNSADGLASIVEKIGRGEAVLPHEMRALQMAERGLTPGAEAGRMVFITAQAAHTAGQVLGSIRHGHTKEQYENMRPEERKQALIGDVRFQATDEALGCVNDFIDRKYHFKPAHSLCYLFVYLILYTLLL